tara:strand:- start:4218 stop:4682 length:465 start_codon:yes stop_codon:yes gene_type:complete
MDRPINIIDKLGALIPGYTGYAEREGRRHCDKQLRSSLSFKMQEIEKKLINHLNNAINNSNRLLMRQIEDVKQELNTLKSKIEYAPYGASSMFSDNQLKESELLKIYEFDLNMSEITNQLSSIVIELNIMLFKEKLGLLQDELNNRNEFIKNHK